jgi:hypothetical protein
MIEKLDAPLKLDTLYIVDSSQENPDVLYKHFLTKLPDFTTICILDQTNQCYEHFIRENQSLRLKNKNDVSFSLENDIAIDIYVQMKLDEQTADIASREPSLTHAAAEAAEGEGAAAKPHPEGEAAKPPPEGEGAAGTHPEGEAGEGEVKEGKAKAKAASKFDEIKIKAAYLWGDGNTVYLYFYYLDPCIIDAVIQYVTQNLNGKRSYWSQNPIMESNYKYFKSKKKIELNTEAAFSFNAAQAHVVLNDKPGTRRIPSVIRFTYKLDNKRMEEMPSKEISFDQIERSDSRFEEAIHLNIYDEDKNDKYYKGEPIRNTLIIRINSETDFMLINTSTLYQAISATKNANIIFSMHAQRNPVNFQLLKEIFHERTFFSLQE